MIDMLKSIGIEKGKPFSPDAQTRETLNAAAREAHALLESRYGSIFSPPYFDNSRWALPALPDYLKAAPTGYAVPDSYPIDSRGLLFTFAFFHCQASRRRPVLFDDGQGQGWPKLRLRK